jgi:hypothetical protein
MTLKWFEKKISCALIIIVLCFLLTNGMVLKIAAQEHRSTIFLNALREGFKRIPDTIQTGVYWYWVSGNISHNGVIKDLQAMKKVGINRAFIAHVTWGEKDQGKVALFSDEWWAILHTAFKTATELGIEIGIFNCPGWSQSGGPWVKSAQSMRYLTSSELVIKGPILFNEKLKLPNQIFQDVKVIAYPAPKDYNLDIRDQNLRISSIPALENLTYLTDKDDSTVLPFPSSKQLFINLSTNKFYTARSLTVNFAPVATKLEGDLQVKVHGTYQTIKQFTIDRTNPSLKNGFKPFGQAVISIPATTGKDFRLIFTGYNEKAGLTEISLSSTPMVENYLEKTLAKMWPYGTINWQAYQWLPQPEVTDQDYLIDPEKVLDLSSNLTTEGFLRWQVPSGKWIIERCGMTPTQVQNVHAVPEGTGLETDKMSKKHIAAHFESFLKEIMRRIPANDRKTWKVVVADSYETGSQNWTDQLIGKFKTRYGYDPVPYIPVMQGKIVKSADHSDRFLWDLRRLIADEIAEEYVGGLATLSHQQGLTTWLENYGHYGFPGEFLQYGSRSDEVSGEFWNEGVKGILENKAAASCAHIYGKNKVSAESFTTTENYFLNHPGTLKKRLDRSFTEGINNTLLHVYIQQPDDNKMPGMNAYFGTEFNRKNIWFNEMDDFIKYIKRCNLLLQQGNYVADVAYFISEDAPRMTGIERPDLPDGYAFDYINAEVIMNRIAVKDGKLVLPDAMQYRILVLPNLQTMRPELLEKISILAQQGAIILGPKPIRSPSLQNDKDADLRVRRLADALWGNNNGSATKINHYGKGLVINGMSVKETLKMLDIIPDVKSTVSDSILYIHRNTKDESIYFISNQQDKSIHLNPEFRILDSSPELWDATTGNTRVLPDYKQNGTSTTVPLELAPYESIFVLFKKNNTGEKLGNANYPKVLNRINVTGEWLVSFDPKMGGPAKPVIFKTLQDWIYNDDNRIKYYSGNARYHQSFNLAKVSKDQRVLLELGNVTAIAKVKVNGIAVGGVWTAPYKIDITKALKGGQNQLEIIVVNNWNNRLVGDHELPEKEKITWTYYKSSKPNLVLQSSGLIGPVCLEIVN